MSDPCCQSPYQAPPDHKNVMSAMWGKLSCSVLMQDWDMALEDLNKLRKDIDETVSEGSRDMVWSLHVCLNTVYTKTSSQSLLTL